MKMEDVEKKIREILKEKEEELRKLISEKKNWEELKKGAVSKIEAIVKEKPVEAVCFSVFAGALVGALLAGLLKK
jgi:ElaB/YqjD/DUF883 family membrane-anchored ribosome-binding protein